MTENRNEYYRDYYEKRREEIAERRKSRYLSDPEYREKAKANTRRYKRRITVENARLRAEAGIIPGPPKGPRKPVDVNVGGVMLKAHTITILAERIGRSIDTVNYWAKIGLLPVTPFRSRRGDRLYTDGMILSVKLAVMARGEVSATDSSFKSDILEKWKLMNIPI